MGWRLASRAICPEIVTVVIFPINKPDEEPKPRLPDSLARPITDMPLSRMENTTFVKPTIIDFHDMGLRTVLTIRTPKENNAYSTP
ncbi:hypothetical protein TNCV_3726581 [Trichonephila clavipes]|nr:hypothetical protein TNCV_3726581 [Trichonephila clavipes]